MYLIKKIKDINNVERDIYIIENKLYLEKPAEFSDESFELVKTDEDDFLSYGWIDSHVHCDNDNSLYGSIPDEIGYKQGVTALIDAGSVGIDNLDNLFMASKKSVTNVFCLLNISSLGIFKQSELSDLSMINIDFDKNKYKDFVVGYKARMSKSVTLGSGVEALKIFKTLREKSELPLMVHVGNEPPKFKDVIEELRKGDVITHLFNFKNNSLFDSNFFPTEYLKSAKNRGIFFDLGHGTESFNRDCALNAIKNDFKFDIISTDIYRRNVENGIVVSLADVMSKIRNCGLSWAEVIEKVTESPAKIFGLKKMGKIEKGFKANLTIFKIVKEQKNVCDSNGVEFVLDEYIKPSLCFVNGKKMEVS